MRSFDDVYNDTPLKKKTKKNKKSDWLVSLSSAQLVLAVIGVMLVLAVSKMSPMTFADLRDEFNLIMQKDMSITEVFVRVRSVFLPGVVQPEITDDVSASGGDDIQVYMADENVCFAPVNTTVDMVMPVNGRITSRFGYRNHPITGKFGVHNGTDFAAEEGTAIYAAFDGTVEEIGSNSVRGNYILLSHGGETQTLYLHCSEIIAPEGAIVRRGEVIARVGNTGYSTGPHLHFSIIVGGKYCNPEWLINDI